MCTCTPTLPQPSPLALFRQNWGPWLWVPALDPFHQGSSLLIWTFRGSMFAGLCLSCQDRHSLKMSRARQLGPSACRAHGIGEVPGGCTPHATLQTSAESQCAAWNHVSSPFPPFPQNHLLLRIECRKHPNQKHRQGSVPVCSCLASQKEDWVACIWQSRCRQSLYWQN